MTNRCTCATRNLLAALGVCLLAGFSVLRPTVGQTTGPAKPVPPNTVSESSNSAPTGGRRAGQPTTSGGNEVGDDPSRGPLIQFIRPSLPRKPAEALAEFETLPGLRIDLVAAEPLVTDRVVATFDELSQLYVGELVDYPYQPAEGGLPLGRIRVLLDDDRDGAFDTARVFADRLLWPTGIVPWRGGIFVAAAPDIWYLKDTDGDCRADDPHASTGTRSEAFQLLGYGPFGPAREILDRPLAAHTDPALQQAAVAALVDLADPQVADLLIDHWEHLAPASSRTAIAFLLSRNDVTERLLAALEDRRLPTTSLTASDRQQLRTHGDESVRSRTETLLGTLNDRGEVVNRYQAALESPADLEQGREVYAKQCSVCHRYGPLGHEVGPNLATTDYHTPETLLAHIVDPNRNVNPTYQQYVVLDQHGQSHTGMIAAKTSGSITLRQQEGKEVEILLSAVESLTNSGLSLMPEGLEKNITSTQMRDLVHYILSIRYDRARTSTLPGLDGTPAQPGCTGATRFNAVMNVVDSTTFAINRSLSRIPCVIALQIGIGGGRNG